MPLRTDPALYEAIVSNLSLGMYVVQDGVAVFLNPRFGEIFGYPSVDNLVERDFFSEVYPDVVTVDLFRQIHEQMLADENPSVAWAQPSTRCDGTPFWLEVEAQRILIHGRPAILGTFKDQTDCQLMAEAMHVSQQTLRLVLDGMEDMVYVVNHEHRIIYANRRMLERIEGGLPAGPCHQVFRGQDRPCEDCFVEKVLDNGMSTHKEFYNQVTRAWYSVIEMPIRMPGQERHAKLAVARDITARKEAEERVRALSHQLLSAQEDERTSLARELHDDLGQRLNAAKIGVETLAEDLVRQGDDFHLRAERLGHILQGSIDAVRQLCAGLHPSSLERLGLVQTLRDHCRQLGEVHGLAIDFKSAGMQGVKLDSRCEINLFRLAQEALHNIVKHAEAGNVKVRLVASHPIIRLRIEDDGKGFDSGLSDADGGSRTRLGLIGMAERVDLLGGEFQVQSKPGEGTRIAVEVPCPITRRNAQQENSSGDDFLTCCRDVGC